MIFNEYFGPSLWTQTVSFVVLKHTDTHTSRVSIFGTNKNLDDCTIFMTYKTCVLFWKPNDRVFVYYISIKHYFFFSDSIGLFFKGNDDRSSLYFGQEIWVATVVFFFGFECFFQFISFKSLQISAFSAPDTSHKLISDFQKHMKKQTARTHYIVHWICNWVLITVQNCAITRVKRSHRQMKLIIKLHVSSCHVIS